MLLIKITGVIIILLNLAGLVYLLLIGFRNMSGNYNKNLSKIKLPSQNSISNEEITDTIIQESIIKGKDDMLDDLDLSDFDDLNLDDFD